MRRCLVLVVAACSSTRDLAVDHVDPGSGPSTKSTPVRIEGSGFRLPIVSDVDEGTTAVGEMAVSIDGIVLADAALRSERQIEATIPAGLAVGPHDVTVTLGERSDTLVGGYVVTDDVTGDAGTDGPPCTFGTWGAPQPIAELNTSGFDVMARLSADELTVYFHSLRAGGSGDRDVWRGTRTSVTAPFSMPVNVTELNTISADRDPSPSGDDLIMVFSSFRQGGAEDLYIATRADRTQAFSTPQPLTGVNSTARDYFPYLTDDGLGVYFSSTRSGAYEIWYAERTSVTASFSAPQLRTDASTTDSDKAPVVSADGLELYLSVGDGSVAQIYASTRSSTAMPFSAPALVPELSTPYEDFPSWLSPDRRRIYLAIDTTGSVTYAIFMATRSCQ